MAVPKKKTSKSRTSSRKASNMKAPSINLTVCKKCGEKVISHTICKVCGHYGGKKILDLEAKK